MCFFADDIDDMVLVDELRDVVDVKLDKWQEILEFKCFKISRIKINI